MPSPRVLYVQPPIGFDAVVRPPASTGVEHHPVIPIPKTPRAAFLTLVIGPDERDGRRRYPQGSLNQARCGVGPEAIDRRAAGICPEVILESGPQRAAGIRPEVILDSGPLWGRHEYYFSKHNNETSTGCGSEPRASGGARWPTHGCSRHVDELKKP